MRTSLNRIKAIDDFLHRKMTKPDAIVFEVQLLLCDDLAEDVKQQQKAYDMIKLYSRNSIKNEISNTYKILATAPEYRSFMEHIQSIFKSS